MAIAVIYYFAAVCVLLYCAYTHKLFKYYTAFKAAASCGFIAVLLCGAKEHNSYFIVVLCAMLACLCGDVLLGLANNVRKYFTRLFMLGILSFAAAHILFTVAFLRYSRFNVFDSALCVVSVLLTLTLTKQKGFHFSKMKAPAVIYSGLVGLVCARGINAFLAQGTVSTALIAAGSILFLVSDLSILFIYFTVKKPRRFVRAFNLLTYYAGLLLLAISV